MAASPKWKVYDSAGKYQAACKEIAAAAALMGLYGEGSTIRYQHSIICWTEGENGDGDHYTTGYDKLESIALLRIPTYYNENRKGA